ncbi:odorant receptor 33b-like [Contarinia nasturtii]|uniref:odorant receptor 33b-like n=1 Tax=Contarinia nasturtii TaxID=265458 RepID=UPI0012D4795B|nr:odorant receptor 33b-like [Contarinia nasturtii]
MRIEGASPSSEERFNCVRMIECVKTFYNCLSLADMAENTLSISYLLQFSVSGIILGICGLQISISLSELARFAFIILFFVCMFIEIYIPCFFGTILHYKSDELTASIFHSNWIEQNAYFKHLMIIFTQGTIRPIRIFAGGLFEVNLPTFLAIVRMAYSMFALLRNVGRV